MIEIYTVGGYSGIGKNCTAIKVDEEVVIADMGIDLENYIKLREDNDIKIDPQQMIDVGAIPDVSVLDKIKGKVKGIVIGHGHLDHVGAAPYLANKFDCEIIGTPFTIEILKSMLKEDKIKLDNKLRVLNSNSYYNLTENIKIELIHITHSIPQSTLIAIHTKYGVVLYANDFKIDLYPTFGKGPNLKRVKEISKENVIALICESTYANDARKMPSESVAKDMLRDVLFGMENKNNLIVVTTFASQIARLNSIIEFGKKLNRKVVFMGRSLAKYTQAAENVRLVNFSKDVEIVKYGRQIERKLKKIDKEREKYLLVVTGHQGEPKSVLHRIATRKFNFKFNHEDSVIFSCKTIPTPTNIANREALEKDLKQDGVRIFKDIHQSGHAAREDLRDFINMVKPRKIIPAHGNKEMKRGLAELAVEMGYKKEDVFLLKDGEKVTILNTKNI
jgi:ribonuclease J